MLIVLGTEYASCLAFGDGGKVRMRGAGRFLDVYRGSKSSDAGEQVLLSSSKASLGYAEAVVGSEQQEGRCFAGQGQRWP